MQTDLAAGIVRILRREQHPKTGEVMFTTVGTGFVVANDGLIATCAHVVEDTGVRSGGAVHLIFHAGREQRTARVESWTDSSAQDVAILRLEGSLPPGVEVRALQRSSDADDSAYRSFGFPEEEGIVGKLEIVGRITQQGYPVLQIRSDEVTPGFSGAPVIDTRTARAIGMVTAIHVPDQYGRLGRTAFVTPAETLFAVYPALLPSDACPYRGLDAFTEDVGDTTYFFGRERVVAQLLDAVQRLPRFLGVLGPSGSGKSSVVRAGLIASLQRGEGGGGHQGVMFIHEYDEPLERLERAGLKNAANGVLQAVQQWLQQHPEQRLVLIMDQFEELLITSSESERRQFLGQLRGLVDAPLALTTVVVMRDDFYSILAQQAADILQRLVQEGIVNVPQTLGTDELVSIVRKPAEAASLHFEDRLVEDIVRDSIQAAPAAGGQTNGARSTVLPLLEFALTQLWDRREDGMLTHKAYNGMGRVTGGLAQWAERAYNSLGDTRLQGLARRVLTDLVRPGNESQGIPDTRWRRPLTELCRSNGERDAIYRIVQHFANARLLVTNRDAQTGQELVELIHDALLREWSDLQYWLNADRRFLAWHNDAAERAASWVASGRDTERLLRGRDLIDAHGWFLERGSELRPAEQEFIQASIDEEQRRRDFIRRLTGIVTNAPKAGARRLALGVVISLAVLVLVQGLGLLNPSELGAYDTLFRIREQGTAPRNIVVVKVDDTMSATGRQMAKVIAALRRDHAAAIGVYVPYYRQALPPADDKALAQAIKHTPNVVLAASIQNGSPTNGVQYLHVQEPLGSLMDSNPAEGVNNLPVDANGEERAVDLIRYAPGDTVRYIPYPAFAVEIASIAGGKRLSSGRIASSLPSHMLINYVGGQDTFWHFQFSGVTHDGAALFRNRIVVIIPDSGQDVVSTPVGRMDEGYVQANVLKTILNGDPIWDGSGAAIPIALVATALVTLLAGRLPLSRAGAGTFILATGYAACVLVLFVWFRVWIPIIAPEVAIVLAFALVMALRLTAAEAQRRRAAAMLGPQIELPAAPVPTPMAHERAAPGLARRPITLLCATLRDFAALAEQLEPGQLSIVLETVQRELAESIRGFGGEVGACSGDVLTAIWKSPRNRQDQCALAVRSALDMVNRMERVNRELGSHSIPPIGYGIGINSGAAVVGRIASPLDTQPVAVGSVVRIAEQLSRAARAGDILAGESACRPLLGRLSVKESSVSNSESEGLRVEAFQVVEIAPEPRSVQPSLAADVSR